MTYQKVKMESRLGAYLSKSRDFPKKEILMAYISNFGRHFPKKLPKKEILMDYISRSCDLPKSENCRGVGAYISRSCNLLKKEI